MKLISPILAAAALMFASCSSTPTHVDEGPVHARTFNFVNRGNRPAPDYADNRAAMHALIQDAIIKNMAAKGVTHVDADGDITVGYLVIVGNNATTQAINDYFSYGPDANALQDKAQDAYSSSKNPGYFQAGTLVIDIIDNHNGFKLVKRNYGTRQILSNATAEVRAERIQELVDQILSSLRVEP